MIAIGSCGLLGNERIVPEESYKEALDGQRKGEGKNCLDVYVGGIRYLNTGRF